jgi:hypothetical protein
LYCSKRECRTGGDRRSLKESEVGCLYTPADGRERNTKIQLISDINKFIFVGDIPYLCKMKTYLKTPTSDLTVHQIRKIVCETIKWCEANVGTKHKSRTLKFCVRTLPQGYTPAYGCYDFNKNCIMVFRNYAPTVKMVVRSVLHEYTHFLQNLRWYNNVLDKVGYNNHPQEIEARGMECFYSVCWNDIKKKI